MRAVLISIKPKWCELIASGKKTVEVRKTAPKLDTPFKSYIYMSADAKPHYYIDEYGDLKIELIPQKVIGEFICYTVNISGREFRMKDRKTYLPQWGEILTEDDLRRSCLLPKDYDKYAPNALRLYEWHISDLVIYDKPKELSEFLHFCPNDFGEKCAECEKFTYSDTGRACCDRRLSRPPQSWCYVEEATKNESI